ncbi:hypothetical protein IAT38_005326 [Cryptococcus sp. DSM 104549]
MPPSLLTTTQARWVLDVLVGVLSGVAIASSAPSAAGGVEMYSGQPGDIRGVIVIMGSAGLGGVAIIRMLHILLPRPWRLYIDRLEFVFISMLWICWTSATMAFSAFTLQQGVCSPTLPEFLLPTCPLLTFDLTLLHLLSTATLALLLVILSSTLDPNYFLSFSEDEDAEELEGSGGKSQGFVMWELALASAPSSPVLGPSTAPKLRAGLSPTTPSTVRSYGTPLPATPLTGANPYAQPGEGPTMPGTAEIGLGSEAAHEMKPPPKRRDKFAEGRVWTYVPLGLCSLGVACASMLVLNFGEFAVSGIFVFIVSIISLIFAIICLASHFSKNTSKLSSATSRHHRALEVSSASFLFILWPLAAVLYTLFPSTPNRPCSNPAASAAPNPREDTEEWSLLCVHSWTVITLAWLAGWLVLGRVMGLIFPMPDVNKVAPVIGLDDGEGGIEEREALLGKKGKAKGTQENEVGARPQVGWGRIVAGEAFELGDDDDDELEDGL